MPVESLDRWTMRAPYPAGAARIEILERVTKPVESELSSLAGLRLVRSLRFDGVSLDTTDRALKMAADRILKHGEVAQAIATAGARLGRRTKDRSCSS